MRPLASKQFSENPRLSKVEKFVDLVEKLKPVD